MRRWIVAAVFASGVAMIAGDAAACGGCFSPPVAPGREATAQVVNGHRMVLAMSPQQTTLWDQFDYSGAPEDFVWVLPVANAATLRIGLADQAFMDALDELTAPWVTGNLPACWAGFRTIPADSGRGALFGCGSSGEGSGLSMMPGSESARLGQDGQAVVGPYAITVIGSNMGGGRLDSWLTDHGYSIPPPTRRVIQNYVDLEFDFVILRLRPGAGVRQMQPVRVTTRGYSPVLPLRMIAAGVGDKVALNLMVVAEGRVEARGFLNEEVAEDDLTFDYQQRRSNWRTIYNGLLARAPGRVWITESAQRLTTNDIVYGSSNPSPPVMIEMGDARTDARPIFEMDVRMPGSDSSLVADAEQLQDAALLEVLSPPDAQSDVAASEGGLMLDFDARVQQDDGGMTIMMPDAAPAAEAYVDRRYAFAGLGANAVVTRLRTDLRSDELNRDLILDSSPRPLRPVGYVGTLLNGPACPTRRSSCAVIGATAPAAMELTAIAILLSRLRRRSKQ